MPKKITADAPRMRKSQVAKLRVAILELQSVRPYLTSDLDQTMRDELQQTLERAGAAIMSIAKWMGEMKSTPAGPRRGSVKAPLVMGDRESNDA